MKIKRENIKDVYDLLCRSKLQESLNGTAYLFFPFEVVEKVEETDAGVILLEANENKYGSKKLVKVGFLIKSDEPIIAYVSDEYSIPFDTEQYIEYFSRTQPDLTVEEKDELYNLECLLVRSAQAVSMFKY